MVEIDGSQYEGGGSMVRLACALSAITKTPCRIFNIRKKREKPGLQAQHLNAIRAVSALSHGRLEGDELNSQEIAFYPGEIVSRPLHLKIETAGSITLVLQAIFPVALFAPSPVEITFEGGATDTFFAPTLDYFQYVFLGIGKKMGLEAAIDFPKRGYYPAGGASGKVKIFPGKPKPFSCKNPGEVRKITLLSRASESLKSKQVGERQMREAREVLRKLPFLIEEKIFYSPSVSPGSSLCIVGELEHSFIGADNLGKLGKRAEDVGKEAALALLEEAKQSACVDRHMGDQILLYMALSQKKCYVTVSQITLHAKTNMWLIEKFLPGKFMVQDTLIAWLPETMIE